MGVFSPLRLGHCFIRRVHLIFFIKLKPLTHLNLENVDFVPHRNQGRSHSLEDISSPAGPGAIHGNNKSPRLQRTMSVNQRSSPRTRLSVQENRFSFNNRGTWGQ